MTAAAAALTTARAEHADEAAGLLQELVRTPSTNPPGDTRAAAAVVARYLEDAGIEVELDGVDAERPCVIARLGTPDGPVVGFNSHIDTVGVGDEAAWNVAGPFSGALEQGSVWGRGAGDAKGSVAAMCVAAALLKRTVPAWRGGLLLAIVGEEETGGVDGTRLLLERGSTDADAWVVGEMTRNEIAVAERGIVWVQLETRGRAAHASTPERGVSAIDAMLELLGRVRGEFGPRLAAVEHRLTPPASLNIGLLEGGTHPNVIADRCTAVLDVRLVPGQEPASLVGELRALVSEHARGDGCADARVRVLLEGAPFATDPGAAVVAAARSACRSTGLPDRLVGFDQTCDARFYADRGIPAIVFGPGDPAVAHTAYEHVRVDDLRAAVRVYANLVIDYLGLA